MTPLREAAVQILAGVTIGGPGWGAGGRSSRAQAGKPVSSWLAEAAASKLRAEALAEFLCGWEAEHGVLTADEVAGPSSSWA